MQKLPQRQGFFKKFAKAIVGFEVACFVATYAVYYKMNRNRDTRYFFHKHFPMILDGYYTLGETLGGLKTREEDQSAWRKENKI